MLVADDNESFLAWAAKFLAAQPGLTLVGSARDGHEAVDMAAALHPDLVLMDVAMPTLNGLQAARAIRDAGGAPRIVMMTLHDSPDYQRAAEAVADGFVVKRDLGRELGPLLTRLFTTPPPEEPRP